MIRFAFKTSLFVLPFVGLYFYAIQGWNLKDGNLTRSGYYFDNPYPKSEMLEEHGLGKYYYETTLYHQPDTAAFEVLIFGDSFSRNIDSYANYMGRKAGPGKILSFRLSELGKNPIETVDLLSRGDFFDSVKVPLVIIESIEMSIASRGRDPLPPITRNYASLMDRLEADAERYGAEPPLMPENGRPPFFAKETLMVPLLHFYIKYMGGNRNLTAMREVQLTRNDLFDSRRNLNRLLYYRQDADENNLNSNRELVLQSHRRLNAIADRLRAKGVRLIFLPVPNKSTAYEPWVAPSEGMHHSEYYEIAATIDSNRFVTVPALRVLRNAIDSVPSFYYWDDTHWSPRGSEVMGEYIYDSIVRPMLDETPAQPRP